MIPKVQTVAQFSGSGMLIKPERTMPSIDLCKLNGGCPSTSTDMSLANSSAVANNRDLRGTGLQPFDLTRTMYSVVNEATVDDPLKQTIDVFGVKCFDCSAPMPFREFMRNCATDTNLGAALYRFAACSRKSSVSYRPGQGAGRVNVFSERLPGNFNLTDPSAVDSTIGAPGYLFTMTSPLARSSAVDSSGLGNAEEANRSRTTLRGL